MNLQADKAPVTPLTKQVSSLRNTPSTTVSPQKSGKADGPPAYYPQGSFSSFCSVVFTSCQIIFVALFIYVDDALMSESESESERSHCLRINQRRSSLLQ